MISRRTFIWCGTVALLPLPASPDPYGSEFFNAVRERIINLAGNGYVAESFEIAPPRNGQRITYGEFMRRQREHRREAFSRLSEEEKAAAWESRCDWLTSELPRLARHGQRVELCPLCSDVVLTAHQWPEAFSCCCGTVIVLDRWLPDDRERVLIRFPVRSWWMEMYYPPFVG
jgi:hypothetical protein